MTKKDPLKTSDEKDYLINWLSNYYKTSQKRLAQGDEKSLQDTDKRIIHLMALVKKQPDTRAQISQVAPNIAKRFGLNQTPSQEKAAQPAPLLQDPTLEWAALIKLSDQLDGVKDRKDTTESGKQRRVKTSEEPGYLINWLAISYEVGQRRLASGDRKGLQETDKRLMKLMGLIKKHPKIVAQVQQVAPTLAKKITHVVERSLVRDKGRER